MRVLGLLSRFRRAPNYPEEVAFWNEVLARKAGTIGDPAARAQVFPKELRDYARALQRGRERKLKLLELGPGPLSLLAAGVDEGLFEITAIDPLARVYNELMDRNGITYPVRPVPGPAEELARQFEADSFDIAYSSNALDHTTSPRRSLEQITRVVRPGGIVFLEGFARNGSHEQWSGLHQHDLVVENGELIRYEQDGARTSLSAGLPLTCVLERTMVFEQRSITAFGYELPEEGVSDPARNYMFWDWFVIAFRKL